MDTISSAEFRKTYAKLTRAVVVTANGHPIGVWTPGTIVGGPPAEAERVRAMTQAERDAILRRVNTKS